MPTETNPHSMPIMDTSLNGQQSLHFWPIFWTVAAFTAASGLYTAFAPFHFANPMSMAETKAIETAIMLLQLGFGTILGLLGGRLTS